MLRDTGKWPDSWYVPPLGDQVLKEHHGQLAELLGCLCTRGGANRLDLGPRLSHSEPLPPDLASEGAKVPPTSDVTGPRDPEPRRLWQWPLKSFLVHSRGDSKEPSQVGYNTTVGKGKGKKKSVYSLYWCLPA